MTARVRHCARPVATQAHSEWRVGPPALRRKAAPQCGARRAGVGQQCVVICGGAVQRCAAVRAGMVPLFAALVAGQRPDVAWDAPRAASSSVQDAQRRPLPAEQLQQAFFVAQ